MARNSPVPPPDTHRVVESVRRTMLAVRTDSGESAALALTDKWVVLSLAPFEVNRAWLLHAVSTQDRVGRVIFESPVQDPGGITPPWMVHGSPTDLATMCEAVTHLYVEARFHEHERLILRQAYRQIYDARW